MRHLPPISLCLNWHHICWSKILLHAFANTESQNAVPWGTNTKNYRPVHTTTSAEFLQHRHKPPANSFPSLCIPLLLLQISSHATLSSSWAIIKTHLFWVNPFESHIMSNMQLRSNQQLPDSITSITLRKTSTDWRYCVPKWLCCASPIVLLICSCFSPQRLKIWMNEGRPHLPDQLLRSCQPNHFHISSTFLAVTES